MALQKSGMFGPQRAPITRNITVLSILQYQCQKGVNVGTDVPYDGLKWQVNIMQNVYFCFSFSCSKAEPE